MIQTGTLQEQLNQAVAELAALGDTSDAIAAELIAQGLKGQCGVGNRCVLAVWFRLWFGQAHHIGVLQENGGWSVWLDLGGMYLFEPLPAHVGQLAAEFDHGRWSELIKR